MPRPLSRSALERLGRRLIAVTPPDSADVEQLHVLLAAYGPVLRSAVEAVTQRVGVAPSSRVKNTGTIIEKLHRSGGHTLGSIHDLGGMRLVVDGGLTVQDEFAAQISDLFADQARAPRLIGSGVETRSVDP